MDLAVVNSRQVGQDVLTLAPSGWTYEFTFVLYDYQTESIWYPMPSEKGEEQFVCISGHYADRELQVMPSLITRWNEWKKDHPDTKILKST